MYRGDFLASLINEHQLQRGAELGLWKGRTFFHLLDNCPSLVEWIGVDEWKWCPERADIPGGQTYHGWDMPGLERTVRKNAAKHGARARIIKADTATAAGQIADGALDIVFVDADHSYQGAKRDIIAWLPKLRPGGWMTGHDCVGLWEPIIVPALKELVPGYQQNSLTDTDAVWFKQV